ncbi:MAG: PD-(D/E)XK nuclease family protein [Candidatus Thorarchaeota archaeon]
MNLRKLGTKKYAIRASSIPQIFKCQWSWVMDYLCDTNDLGGEAAQTGTAVGRGIELWHGGRSLKDVLRKLAVDSMTGADGGASGHPFPEYDEAKTELLVTCYTNDPRNKGIKIVGQELEVRLELPPHEWDETGEPILIVGHIDQIREYVNGIRRLWDVKAGKPGGMQALGLALMQQMAYLVGLQDTEFAPVQPGGIIRMMDYVYRGKPKPLDEATVFYRYDLTLDDASMLMDQVRLSVAAMRAGDISITPGMHCGYCDAGDIGGCMHAFREQFGL